MLSAQQAQDRAAALIDLARAAGADAADAVYSGGLSEGVQVRLGKLEDVERSESEHLDLRVFVDRGSVEVYVNGGHQVLSSYSYASEGPRAIKLVAESGSLKVDSLKLHHMKSIGLE